MNQGSPAIGPWRCLARFVSRGIRHAVPQDEVAAPAGSGLVDMSTDELVANQLVNEVRTVVDM